MIPALRFHGAWAALTILIALSGIAPPLVNAVGDATPVVRLGLVGLDTSHVITYTRIFNDPQNADHVPGAKVVAGWKGGSPDLPASADRLEGFTRELRGKWGVEIVDSIPELCKRVDGVLLTSVDGRVHLAQAQQVVEAGVPLFIDKPIAASLEDVVAIAKLARQHRVPWFGGSSLRWYGPMREAIQQGRAGAILGCDAYSPCALEPHHPDLYWYGVHGVELLYTVMGPGCKSVTRTSTADTDVVVGVWEDGRVGTFRGTRKGPHSYGATIFGSKGNPTISGHSDRGMAEEMVKFFQTRKSPITDAEMVEVYAFMTAAEESKRQGGKPVQLPQFSLR